MSGDSLDLINLDTFDYFDGDPSANATLGEDTTSSLNLWSSFVILNRSKKILYTSTVLVIVTSFVALVLCCIAISKSTDPIINGLLAGSTSMIILTHIIGYMQVAFYKEKDIIISI